MAQLKDCPDEFSEAASHCAIRDGKTYFVLFDLWLGDFVIRSQQTDSALRLERAGLGKYNKSYDLRAVCRP